MQEFSSSTGRHAFKVDGRTYYLPMPTIGDVSKFSDLAEASRVEQANAMRDMLVGRAHPARLTLWERFTGKNPAATVIDEMGLLQSTELFKSWASFGGLVDTGESSSSAD